MIIPSDLKIAFWTSAAFIALSWAYSIYMAWVNWKQAKVYTLVQETNNLLRQILEEAKKQ